MREQINYFVYYVFRHGMNQDGSTNQGEFGGVGV
jgi:hypothetical protein